jgi:hypothetical protein
LILSAAEPTRAIKAAVALPLSHQHMGSGSIERQPSSCARSPASEPLHHVGRGLALGAGAVLIAQACKAKTINSNFHDAPICRAVHLVHLAAEGGASSVFLKRPGEGGDLDAFFAGHALPSSIAVAAHGCAAGCQIADFVAAEGELRHAGAAAKSRDFVGAMPSSLALLARRCTDS